jgi:putative phage-type endonuclease
MQIINVPQGSPEWHEERRKGIGGSDAAAILGLSKWNTPMTLWMEKTGVATEQERTQEQARGNFLEGGILEWYQWRTEQKVERINGIIRSEENPIMQFSPDGIADGRIVVQVKTALIDDEWGEEGTDQIPPEYLIQVQHEMAVVNFNVAHVPVLFPHFDFGLYIVHADAELQQMIRAAEQEWWENHVLKNVTPEPTTHSDVVRKYGQAKVGPIEATPEIAEMAKQLADIKAQLKLTEQEKEEVEAQIKNFMGPHDTLMYRGERLATWNNTKGRQSFDRERFARAHPALSKEFTKIGQPGRTFLLK